MVEILTELLADVCNVAWLNGPISFIKSVKNIISSAVSAGGAGVISKTLVKASFVAKMRSIMKNALFHRVVTSCFKLTGLHTS